MTGCNLYSIASDGVQFRCGKIRRVQFIFDTIDNWRGGRGCNSDVIKLDMMQCICDKIRGVQFICDTIR